MLNARTPFRRRIRARALAAPDLDKCTAIAALVSAILMIAAGLILG